MHRSVVRVSLYDGEMRDVKCYLPRKLAPAPTSSGSIRVLQLLYIDTVMDTEKASTSACALSLLKAATCAAISKNSVLG